MKIIILFILTLTTIFATEYYSKLEPIKSYQIKSAVAGKIVYVNDKIEGFNANNSLVVEIDSIVNKVDLEQSKNKLKYIDVHETKTNINYVDVHLDKHHSFSFYRRLYKTYININK